MSSCNFCFCVIKEKYDPVILEKGTKHGCRNCINRPKRHRTVNTHLEDLKRELRKVANQNVSKNKSQVTALVYELQSTATIENELIDCTAEKRKKVEVTVIAKWPSKEERKNLPEDVTSLGKTLVQGTNK